MTQTPPEDTGKRLITGGVRRGEASLPSAQSVNDFHGRSDVDASVFAQHHTLGSGRLQASPGNHVHDGSNSSFVLLTRRTTADQTKWATQNVFEDITNLYFDTEPNAYYGFKALIFALASAGSLTYQFGFTLPVNATIQWTSNATSTAATSGSIVRERQTTVNPTTPALPIGTTAQSLIPTGVLFSGNGGRVQLQLRKLVATAGTLTVFANSTFKGERIAA